MGVKIIKDLTLVFMLAFSMFGASIVVACELPPFIKKGVQVRVVDSDLGGVIVEIDKESCWVRVENKSPKYSSLDQWINVGSTYGLRVKRAKK